MFFPKPIILAMAATVVATCLRAEPVQLKCARPWEAAEDDGQSSYRLDYSGKGWPGLSFSQPLDPDRYYRVTWEMKNSFQEADATFMLMVKMDQKCGRFPYTLSQEWNTYTGYFYSGQADEAHVSFYPNPGAPKTIAVKNVRCTQLSPETLRATLLPNGNFEACADLPTAFRKRRDTLDNLIELAGPQDFLAGEKSLAVSFQRQNRGKSGIRSIQMPVVPGQNVDFSFWAKAEKTYVITVILQAWSGFGHRGKHFCKFHRFKITPEWHEYSARVDIPEAIGEYLDLQDRLLFITIRSENNNSGKVWFDEMAFRATK
jgi:hypothetical protein